MADNPRKQQTNDEAMDQELRDAGIQSGQDNPGNFANRPQEEVEEAAREGGSK